jgi:hypothetical protein
MNRFLKNILFYFIVFLAILFLFECLIYYKINNGNRYYFQADWHDLKNHNSDILFIGNSRTWVHVDPFKIQNRFKVKCEIIAVDGQGPHLTWLKFKEYIKSNTIPKEIYLQFDPLFFTDKKDLFGLKTFRTGFFLDRIDLSSLKKYEGFSNFYRFIPLLAIDAPLLFKIISNDTVSISDSYEMTHGFKSQNIMWKGNWKNPEYSIINEQQSSYIDSFVMFSKKNKACLYAIYSPQSLISYMNTKNPEILEKKVNYLSKIYNYPIEYINFNPSQLYNDSSLFYNHTHLNNHGVDIFMNQLLNNVKAFKTYRKD